jgi:predicted acylesterase/phospholipase RssA
MSNREKLFVPAVQRALVLQGGGAPGAYQVGAFRALYEKLRMTISNNYDDNNEPLFDIIVGTSIGAINGAILISHFLENRTWKGSAERLEEFWKYLSNPTPQIAEALERWKAEKEKGNNPYIASEEAARRYYSVKEFYKSGVKNVFQPMYPPKEDKQFYDSENQWLVYDNGPLRKSVEKYVKFPIATSIDRGEPRLLVISVDAIEGTTVTFDSYEKEKGIRETQYGNPPLEKSITIKYDEGLDIKHLMASSTLPEFYGYEEIDGRKFWDGGLLSNTPIRELLEAHKEFWEKKIGTQNLKNSLKRKINAGNDSGQESIQRIPDLELYIINVFSPMENRDTTADNCRLEDIDEIRDRKMDITLSDGYDAKTDELFTDYLNLIERLISLGENDEMINERINKILEEYTLRRFSTEEVKTNFDILISNFKIVKVVQVQRKDDPDSISGKLGDFTSETLNKWIQEGYQDTIKQ